MYDKYLIQKGDNLKDIAERFYTDETTIKDINNMPFDDFYTEGKEIIVPLKKEKCFEYYTINAGDTIYEIARKYNMNPDLLSILNGLDLNDYIYPNQEILIPKNNYSYYVTKEGDSLDVVAEKFDMEIGELLKDNDTIYLSPGQLIVKNNKNMIK